MRFALHLGSIPRHLIHFLRGHTPRHLRLRNRLLTILSVTLVVDLVGSYFMWKAERRVVIQPPGGANFGVDFNWAHTKDFWDSAFFVTTQLLTVSSLENNPYSTWGRVIDVLLEFYGITIATALAGSFGAFFLTERHVAIERHDDPGPASIGQVAGSRNPGPAP
jgi:hypothetical protein